jgi:hypothetical protein
LERWYLSKGASFFQIFTGRVVIHEGSTKMAKLSARGRKELVRVSRTLTLSPEESSVTLERRTTLALMDDRTVLEKLDVVFRSDGAKHSYGWKVRGKAKEGVTVDAFLKAYEKAGYAQV